MQKEILLDTGNNNIEIAKYTAISICGKNLVGYIIDQPKSIGNGCYSNSEKEYIIIVNKYTMPNSMHRGLFKVKNETIKTIKGR